VITLPLARSPRSLTILALAGLALAAFGARCPPGLDIGAYLELRDAGVSRYVGQFHPVESESFGDWTLHRFDPQDGEGPICLDGTPFTVFSRVRDPKRAIVYFAGGGACWQGMYACSARARTTPPDPAGIFVDGFEVDGEWIENPLADWSLLYVSACDGSFFGGDNDVVDPDFSLGGVRHHRGVRTGCPDRSDRCRIDRQNRLGRVNGRKERQAGASVVGKRVDPGIAIAQGRLEPA